MSIGQIQRNACLIPQYASVNFTFGRTFFSRVNKHKFISIGKESSNFKTIQNDTTCECNECLHVFFWEKQTYIDHQLWWNIRCTCFKYIFLAKWIVHCLREGINTIPTIPTPSLPPDIFASQSVSGSLPCPKKTGLEIIRDMALPRVYSQCPSFSPSKICKNMSNKNVPFLEQPISRCTLSMYGWSTADYLIIKSTLCCHQTWPWKSPNILSRGL